jgi:hypothetical protein
MPRADVHNACSWLAVGIAVGSGVGVAVGHIALGFGLGVALGVLGALLSKRERSDRPDED